MWPFKKKEPKYEYGGVPAWDIAPIAHGKWAIRIRKYWPHVGPFGGLGRYYFETLAIYDTREEAEADAKHLGLLEEV